MIQISAGAAAPVYCCAMIITDRRSISRPIAANGPCDTDAIDDPHLRDLVERGRDALARHAPRAELLALIEDIADANREGLRAERHTGANGHGENRVRARVRLLEQMTQLILALRAGEPDSEQRIAGFLAAWPPRQGPSSTFEQF